MNTTELINVSKILLDINDCSKCVFDSTCENLIDNYKDTICQVLEKEMEDIE